MEVEFIEKMRQRYKLHPLIFHRSLEHARSEIDLFDILDSFPKEYPIIWSEVEHCWIHNKDLTLRKMFNDA